MRDRLPRIEAVPLRQYTSEEWIPLEIQPIEPLKRANTPEARAIWAGVSAAPANLPEWMRQNVEVAVRVAQAETVDYHEATRREVQRLHDEAMQFAEDAELLKVHGGNSISVKTLVSRAFESERKAAEAYHAGPEPTRSVLFRSAATLALECGHLKAAHELATKGLQGNPPPEIAAELRSLLDGGM